MHLVMHGSSSVPQDPAGHHQRQWRQDEADLGRAGRRDPARHQNGVRKINIDTDNRMAMTGQIRKVLSKDNPEEFDPRKYLKPAMEAMTKLCKLAAAGIQHRRPGQQDQESADDGRMAKRYVKGELDPKVA